MPKGIVLLLLLLAAAPLQAASVVLYQHNWHYSGSLPLNFLENKWLTKIKKTADFSEGFTETRVGAALGGFSLSHVWRAQVSVEHSADFLDLLFTTKKKQSLQSGREYNLWLKANILNAQGMRLGYHWKSASWGQLELAYTHLQAREFYQGYWRGQATALGASDYDFNLDVDYYYSKDMLFERRIDRPLGQGYSMDLQYQWLSDKLELLLLWQNLNSAIIWDRAPHTSASANSATKQYDADGYVIFNPLLSGRESYRRLVQRLPQRRLFQISFVERRKVLQASVFCTALQCYPRLAIGRRSPTTHYELSYALRSGSPGVSIRKPWLQFRLEANEDWYKATQLSLLLSLQIGFDKFAAAFHHISIFLFK